MHGVQPSPNRMPSIGAPIRPMVGARWMRHSRADPGRTPMNARPMTIVMTPSTRWMVTRVLDQPATEPAEERAEARRRRP